MPDIVRWECLRAGKSTGQFIEADTWFAAQHLARTMGFDDARQPFDPAPETVKAPPPAGCVDLAGMDDAIRRRHAAEAKPPENEMRVVLTLQLPIDSDITFAHLDRLIRERIGVDTRLRVLGVEIDE
jgi:hypothetical protein